MSTEHTTDSVIAEWPVWARPLLMPPPTSDRGDNRDLRAAGRPRLRDAENGTGSRVEKKDLWSAETVSNQKPTTPATFPDHIDRHGNGHWNKDKMMTPTTNQAPVEDPRPFKIYRDALGGPRWFQPLVEAWWILRGRHSLHSAWQAGHDHGTKMEFTRTVRRPIEVCRMPDEVHSTTKEHAKAQACLVELMNIGNTPEWGCWRDEWMVSAAVFARHYGLSTQPISDAPRKGLGDLYA